MTLSGRQPCGVWGTLYERVDFIDVSHEPQPNSRSPSGSHRRTKSESGQLRFAVRTVHACKPLTFCFTASPGDAFKSEHPPLPLRPRLFPPAKWVSRCPVFSFCQAV